MLIQAYCQQEREKRCTITANSGDVKSTENDESSSEKMDSESTEQTERTKTPKAEPNISPTPNDVEMIDAPEPITVIKQEPEDDVTSIEMDSLADGTTNDSTNKCDNKNDTQPEMQAVKTEADESGNESNRDSNKDNQSDSSSEPIKIEESTTDKDDPYSKDINIDPRTYCKLGHFHLLLEDYAKGTTFVRPIISPNFTH